MKNLLLLIIIAVTASVACKNNKPAKKNERVKHKLAIAPDSTVNNFLALRNAVKTPDSLKKMITDSAPLLVFTTDDELEYLVAFQHPEDEKGSFVGFQISHLSNDLLDLPTTKLPINEFKTQSGIRLDMTVEELLEIKGNNVQVDTSNEFGTYRYIGAPPDFLQRHNSEEYILECQTVNGTISTIRFGFINRVQREGGIDQN